MPIHDDESDENKHIYESHPLAPLISEAAETLDHVVPRDKPTFYIVIVADAVTGKVAMAADGRLNGPAMEVILEQAREQVQKNPDGIRFNYPKAN